MLKTVNVILSLLHRHNKGHPVHSLATLMLFFGHLSHSVRPNVKLKIKLDNKTSKTLTSYNFWLAPHRHICIPLMAWKKRNVCGLCEYNGIVNIVPKRATANVLQKRR